MRVEKIKLTPKKGGNGYTSSYSVSIGKKEIEDCHIRPGCVIKIVDPENSQIVVKEKSYTLTEKVLNKVIDYSYRIREENENISKAYTKMGDGMRSCSVGDLVRMFIDEQEGKVSREVEQEYQLYLESLPIETLIDLVLIMYMGRDKNANMRAEPGFARYIDYFEYRSYIVIGVEKAVLISILMEKPLWKYLPLGVGILNSPVCFSSNNEYDDEY